jgi:hypothetical protein
MKRWAVLLALIGTCWGQIENPPNPPAREDLGFSTNLNTLWTATNSSNARSAVGLGSTNNVQFGKATIGIIGNFDTNTLLDVRGGLYAVTANIGGASFGSNLNSFTLPVNFGAPETIAQTRTNLSLGWSGLTNTNASGFRSSLQLSASWLTNTNVTNFRSDIGLGWSALSSNTNTNIVRLTGFNTNNVLVTPASELRFTNNSITVTNIQNPYIILTDATKLFFGTNWENIEGMSQVTALFNGALISFSEETPLYTNNADFSTYGINFYGNTEAMAFTRTNLGLGSGITTNRAFVSYNGTNYTTNSVTISNGVITGWTQ